MPSEGEDPDRLTFWQRGAVRNVQRAARKKGDEPLAQARGGEIVASARLVEHLAEIEGERVELSLRNRTEPVVAYRISR